MALSVLVAWGGSAGEAHAQLGALLSPGPLARPHAKLEGLTNCQACHERGQRVTAEKCLTCHKPVAERIARKSGVHRNVSGDCVTCHAEHAGVDGELRPFDQARFDHATATGFALDGKHAPIGARCAACHKERSFLTARTACSSCHTDVHKGSLGAACTSCHSTKTAFKDLGGQFDHTKAAFQLLGAHRAVACGSCHVNNKSFKGLKFAACTDCHRDPHRAAPSVAAVRTPVVPALAGQPQPFGTACTTCHTNDTWRTKKIDHDTQTAFPLKGRHADADCVSCHNRPALRVRPKADTCAACHTDPHRGTFAQDCRTCHTETTFKQAPFDHTKTAFALTGKHDRLACVACHKGQTAQAVRPPDRAPARPPARGRGAAARPAPGTTVAATDFRGLKAACASCHEDIHQAELGPTCERCHTTSAFRMPGYVHPRFAEFFTGQHAKVACEKCHAPMPPTRPVRTNAAPLRVKFKSATTACVSCHRDEHLGQVAAACENCHSVQQPKFALAAFSHARTPFPLTGKHETVACALCHKVETGAFPSGKGTAIRLKGVATDCRGCHADVHMEQLAEACETCHTTHTFRVAFYRHRNRSLAEFFTGRHVIANCGGCHKQVNGQFPAGAGNAIRFQAETRCVACHTDKHRGSLGRDCITCHKP